MNEKESVNIDLRKVGESIKPFIDFFMNGTPDTEAYLEALRTNPDFAKSFDDKVKQLGRLGYASEAQQVQQLLLELIVQTQSDFAGQMDADTEGRIFMEGDRYGYVCRILRLISNSFAARIIINHRQFQLKEFARIGDDETPGLRLTTKDRSKQISKEEKKEMVKWNDVLINKFFYIYGSSKPKLSAVLGAMYNDVFTLNRLTLFCERDKSGKPLALVLVDPAQVRELSEPHAKERRYNRDEYEKLLNDKSLRRKNTEDYLHEFRYGIYDDYKAMRTVRLNSDRLILNKFIWTSDARRAFDINSPLQYGVEIAQGIISAVALNMGQISFNATPKGILAFINKGERIGDPALNKFKQNLWTYIRAPELKYRMPTLELPEGGDVKFLQFFANNRDMMYFEWIALLFTILCRLSGTDPNELSFASHKGVVEGHALVREGMEGVSKISVEIGRDRILEFFLETVNESGIIEQLTGHNDWELEVTGLHVTDKQKRVDLMEKELRTLKSMNELRAEEDLEPIDTEKYPFADVPGFGNTMVANLFAQQMMMEQQQEAMAQQAGAAGQPGGEAGAEGGAPPPVQAIEAGGQPTEEAGAAEGGPAPAEKPQYPLTEGGTPGGESESLLTPEDEELIAKMTGKKKTEKSIIIELVD